MSDRLEALEARLNLLAEGQARAEARARGLERKLRLACAAAGVLGCFAFAGMVVPADSAPTANAKKPSIKQRVTLLEQKVAALEGTTGSPVLQAMTRVGNDIFIDGVNVHIRNGSGNTTVANGLGNLIVGYNETRPAPNPNVRDGSHVVVIGRGNNFSGAAGLVVGENNLRTGNFSSISGGFSNEAVNNHASVAGGLLNIASGPYSAAIGGCQNTASGENSTVTGGLIRNAPNINSWAAGGLFQNN